MLTHMSSSLAVQVGLSGCHCCCWGYSSRCWCAASSWVLISPTPSFPKVPSLLQALLNRRFWDLCSLTFPCMKLSSHIAPLAASILCTLL